jgi:WD40 repeat protein
MGYDGFISYSHAADGRLAPALQRGLQRLAKKWNSRRALHVFRDETGLSTNPHLWSAIETALDDSDWFVLLASPESAASEWVNKEIAHWVATKPLDHILPVVTDGTWEWDQNTNDFTADSTSVPPALRGALREEARHLDLRWARNETDLDLRNSRFRGAVADLAAPMHGIAKDDLEGEDIRQHRRARNLARAGVSAVVMLLVVSVIFGGVAVSQRNQARTERTRAERSANEALARGLAAKADAFLREHRADRALLLAVEAEHFAELAGPSGPSAQQARDTLLRAIASSPSTQHLLDGQTGTARNITFSPDGSTIVSISDTGAVRAWDATTHMALARQLPPTHDGQMVSADMSNRGLLVTGSFDYEGGGRAATRLWDLKNGTPYAWQPPQPPASPTTPGAVSVVSGVGSFSPDGSLVMVSKSNPLDSGAPATFDFWDVAQRRRVGRRVTLTGAPVGGEAWSTDGRQFAVGLTVTGVPGLAIQIVDVATGAIHPLIHVHDGTFVETLGPFFAAIAFSPDGRRISSVASGATDSGVATIATQSGTRVAQSAVGVGQSIMGASPDLRELVLKTATGASVVDATTGERLTDLPLNTDTTLVPPLAFDPTRPNVAYPDGAGFLTIADWTKLGAPRLVTTNTTRRRLTEYRLSPNGAVVDLGPPLRKLGLSAATYKRRPWQATVSAGGEVAILDGTAIAIWDPARRAIVRRLTGAPSGCVTTDPAQTYPDALNLAFAGSAVQGRVVLGCPPVAVSWNLASSRSEPDWRKSWTHRSDNTGGFVISTDRATVADNGLRGVDVLDAHTGRIRASGPEPVSDNLYALALSPDARTVAVQHWTGLVDLVDTTNGTVRYTLSRSTPGNSENPSVAFSADGNLVASWNDEQGMEVWDATSGEAIAHLDGRIVTSTEATRGLVVNFADDNQSVRLVEVRRPVAGEGAIADPAVRLIRTTTWSLRTADWIDAACTIVNRDLTKAEWRNYVSATLPYQSTCTSPRASTR